MKETDRPPTTTDIDIPGANCPWCLNETIDALRDLPGVVKVEASMSGQCLQVEHRCGDTEGLLRTVQSHLRRDQQDTLEHVMGEVTPTIGDGVCRRHGPSHRRDS